MIEEAPKKGENISVLEILMNPEYVSAIEKIND